jgi:hypothetical protein
MKTIYINSIFSLTALGNEIKHVFRFVFLLLFVFVLCHVCPMLSLNYPFLIAPSVFSDVYRNTKFTNEVGRYN